MYIHHKTMHITKKNQQNIAHIASHPKKSSAIGGILSGHGIMNSTSSSIHMVHNFWSNSHTPGIQPLFFDTQSLNARVRAEREKERETCLRSSTLMMRKGEG